MQFRVDAGARGFIGQARDQPLQAIPGFARIMVTAIDAQDGLGERAEELRSAAGGHHRIGLCDESLYLLQQAIERAECIGMLTDDVGQRQQFGSVGQVHGGFVHAGALAHQVAGEHAVQRPGETMLGDGRHTETGAMGRIERPRDARLLQQGGQGVQSARVQAEACLLYTSRCV